MANQSGRHTFSTSSLHDLCLCKLIEEFDHYSPEMLSLLPPVQRKELLLYCPVISICHLEQTCAFNDINSDIFWDELLGNQYNRYLHIYNINANDVLPHSDDREKKFPSNREKYFTFLTAMIFSGDRFSGHYLMSEYDNGHKRYLMYEGGDPPPPGQRSCPVDIVNCLVAYRKPGAVLEEMKNEEQLSETSSSDEEGNGNIYSPLPVRDVFGLEYGELYEEATKGQHIPSCYLHYISKENHYRLLDEDAIALMMNECSYYPKKLFMHEYEHIHWKWSDEDLMQLLTQFFSRLESLSLYFRKEKEAELLYYRDICTTTIADSKRKFELIFSCCFSSPALSSLVISDCVSCDRTEFLSMFATKSCPSLKKLQVDIHCSWRDYGGKIHHLEALANVITSHSQLSEICLNLNIGEEVAVSSFSWQCLYTSLIGFVQRMEFSILSLHGKLLLSSHLRRLLNVFLKTPCSQPQEIHLYPSEDACSEDSPIHLPVGDNKIPSGALEYKSLFFHDFCSVTVDFCEWLFSHQPLVLKAFHFDVEMVNFDGEFGKVPPKTAFPVEILCDNALFQTRELLLPIFNYHYVSSHIFQSLLHRQQLTKLSLTPAILPEEYQKEEEPKPCSIGDIMNILSVQKETLTELDAMPTNYYTCFVSDFVGSSAEMEHFGDALFSLKNYEIFSLFIQVTWKAEDVIYIDSLYNSWLKHGCKKLKSFQMGDFEYGFILTDELARKMDKIGLVIRYHV